MSEHTPVALVTGANRGIGLELVEQYAALGWQLIATCRNPDDADELQAVAAQYPGVAVEAMDLVERDTIDALALPPLGQLGKVKVLYTFRFDD